MRTIAVCVGLLTGCGSVKPADLSDAEVVKQLANRMSAPKAYWVAELPLLAVDEEVNCPALDGDLDGEGTLFLDGGGCVDGDGVTWKGSASIERSEAGLDIVYDRLRLESEGDCGKEHVTEYDGTVVEFEQQDLRFEVDLNGKMMLLDDDGCATGKAVAWSLDYVGTKVSDDDAEVWSGSGVGGVGTLGEVQAETVDERLDDTCSSEAESGATTMQSNGDVAVITYDGATNCDEDATVTWTLNGQDQGEMSGVDCSTFTTQPGLAAWGLLVLAGLVRRRRGLYSPA